MSVFTLCDVLYKQAHIEELQKEVEEADHDRDALRLRMAEATARIDDLTSELADSVANNKTANEELNRVKALQKRQESEFSTRLLPIKERLQQEVGGSGAVAFQTRNGCVPHLCSVILTVIVIRSFESAVLE